MRSMSPEARAVVKSARQAYGPSPADRARLRRALLLRVAGASAAAGGAALASVPAAAGPAVTTTALVKASTTAAGAGATGLLAGAAGVAGKATALGAVSAFLVGAAAATILVAAPPTPRSAPLAPGPSAAPVATAKSGPPAARTRDTSAPASAAAAASVPRSSVEIRSPVDTRLAAERIAPSESAPIAAGSPQGVRAEVALLAEAQHALLDGQPDLALDLLARHKSLFPNAVLTQEREAARIVALCRMGRVSEAHSEARLFLQSAPSSPLAERVRTTCAPISEGADGDR